MAQQRLRVRRLSDEEGRQLQRIVRRGGGKTDKSIVKWRRSMVVLASAGGNSVEAIARLVQTSPDRVREMIHRFNELGMASLDPRWAGGRPRRITTDDEAFIVTTAKARTESLGQPFTRWSIRKLVDYLQKHQSHPVVIGRERLRALLAKNDVTFQRTKTWKESNDPLRDEKLDRIEEVLEHFPDRVFAFDEFGPLGLHPIGGRCWAGKTKPQRLRANFHKFGGVRQFHGCCNVGDDQLFGTLRQKKGAENTLAALRQIRARRPDGETIYVILDNLSAHKGKKIRTWCERHAVELSSPRPTPPGPTRSSASSAPFASSCSTTPTTRATSSSPSASMPTSPGATRTRSTLTSSPPSARSGLASAPSDSVAGDDPPPGPPEPSSSPAGPTPGSINAPHGCSAPPLLARRPLPEHRPTLSGPSTRVKAREPLWSGH